MLCAIEFAYLDIFLVVKKCCIAQTMAREMMHQLSLKEFGVKPYGSSASQLFYRVKCTFDFINVIICYTYYFSFSSTILSSFYYCFKEGM